MSHALPLTGAVRRWLAGAVVAAMVALVTVAVTAHGAGAVPVATGFGAGDGLNRFVVTVREVSQPGPLAAAAHSAVVTPTSWTPGTGTQPSGDAGPTSGQRGLDAARLSAAEATLGTGGSLAVDGAGVFYVVGDQAIDVSTGGDGRVVAAPSVGADGGPAGPAAPSAPSPAASAPPAADAPAAVTADELAALRAHAGVVSAQTLNDNRVLLATTLSLADVRAFPEVSAAEESTSVPVLGDPTDPFFSTYGWNLNNTGHNASGQTDVAGADVNAPDAWTATQGQDTVVAVVDTGYYSLHADMAGALWNNPTEPCGTADTNGNGKAGDCHGWNFYKNNADVDNSGTGTDGQPLDEHGTSVSGVIAARANNGIGSAGVAPLTKIMPLVVGGGSTVDINLAAQAFRYAADNGATVINASFGGSFTGAPLTALSDAIDYATAKGVLVVAAAGNDAADRDTSPLYPASLPNPGIVTVGSTTAADTVAGTSAYGQTSVDLFAPGDLVFTIWPDGGYRLVSGTSIAAPHVAAAVALYRSLYPALSAADLKGKILADSTKLTALTTKSVSGGRLDLNKLQAAGGASAATYTFSAMNAVSGSQSPRVTIASTSGSGSYSVVLGLAMLVDGEIWAVADQPVTLAGQTATTNQQGQVTFSLGALSALDGITLNPGLTLLDGSYGLTVQIVKDGVPLSRPYAAPLTVGPLGSTPVPGTTPAPGSTQAPGTTPGSGSTPGASSSPAPGSGSTPAPGSSPAPGTTPGSGTGPGSGSSPAPGTTPAPGSSPGSGTGPGPGSSPAPGTTPAPGTSPGPGSGGDPGSGSSPVPGSTPAPGSGSAPSDSKSFPTVGAFGVTSISPVHVSVNGGTLVTVSGIALETGIAVRVSGSLTAEVVASMPGALEFKAPAALPGTYDVTLFKDSRSSVLPAALVYQAVVDPSAGSTPAPGSGSTPPAGSGPGSGSSPAPGSSPGSGSSPAPGSSPGTGSTPAPGTSPGAGSAPQPGSSPSSAPTTPTTPTTTRTGPHGEHLVRYDALGALTGLWALQCSTTCTGLQV